MAAPVTKRFATLVSDFAAGAQAASATLLDFSVGSIFRALGEANAGVATWLQKLYLFALSVVRLQTSQGVWVDSWLAQFMPAVPGTTSPRLPAVAATGIATFSRFTATAPAVIPVGALVATKDGTQVFAVYADTANPAYSATATAAGTPGYVIAAGVATLNAPIQAVDAGAAGNVKANTITALRQGIIGVDAVTNGAPLINGLDAETDAAAKARFKLFIASLPRSTNPAIGYALGSLGQGVQWTITENRQYAGANDNGYLTVVVDDGSGAPSSALLAAAALAVDAYRAAGVRFGVFPPVVIGANVSFTITTAPGYSHSALVASTAAAVGAYINGLGLGNPLRWSRLEQVIYDVSPGITNVTSLQLNSAIADLVATPLQTVKTTSVTVA